MRTKTWRMVSQLLFVGLVAYLGMRHQVVGGGPSGAAPIDSYCPFGGVETLFSYVSTGQFLQKTNLSNFIILAATIITVIIAGGSFCGWICPFGAIQEWMAKIGKKVFGKQLVVPQHLHKPLTYVRYLVFVLIVSLTVLDKKLIFETYDPFKVAFHFNFETTTAVVIFVLTILVSLIVDRAWCKYLCPLGGLLSIFSKFSLIKLKRNTDSCIGCGQCVKACPMQIKVHEVKTVPEGSCVKCLECMDSCPIQETLGLELGGGR